MEWVVYILHITCNDVYFRGVYIFVTRKTIDERICFLRKPVSANEKYILKRKKYFKTENIF